MKLCSALTAFVFAVLLVADAANASLETMNRSLRENQHKKKSSKDSKSKSKSKSKSTKNSEAGGNGIIQRRRVTLHAINLAYQQPWSGFFVMVHSKQAEPLFTYGKKASRALTLLAENGDPSKLVRKFRNARGVCSAKAHTEGAPNYAGQGPKIKVRLTERCDRITIAAMVINTNDAFVALNGVKVRRGHVYYGNGLDAGTEENNEHCDAVPGPACPAGSGNERSRNGEGVVHVHRGFHGVGPTLSAAGYDWRNPMMLVEVK